MRFGQLPNLLIRHPLLVGILAGLATLVTLESFLAVEQQRRVVAERNAVQAQVSTVRARLESALNASLSLSLSLPTLVLSKPDFQEADFVQVAASLVRIQPGIRSVALAPDNVIRHVYPLAGNERALGLRYMDTPEQRQAVLRMMRDLQPVIAGPVNLVQGGMGIINRIPIQFTGPDGALHYWGLASVAVDPYPIFRSTGLLGGDQQGLEFALRGRDGLGRQGQVFLGKPEMFQDPGAVLMDVLIPGGTWQLAARPWSRTDNRHGGGSTLALQVAALLVAAWLGFMVRSTLAAHRHVQTMALHDSLTGLANRHQFSLRGENLFSLAKRSGRPITLLNMDLNGFKRINDTRGHATGDQVLRQVADRLRQCFRESDLLARVGGDEFLALLPDTGSGPRLDTLLQRIRASLAQPMPVADPPVSVTVSIGVAHCSELTLTLEDLMHQADSAMYRAKNQAVPEPGGD